jgi:hypothetical protein
MTTIFVYYEDQAARGDIQEFQPHNLVCACVADRLGRSVFEIRAHIRGEPKKADTKLLRACERVAADPGWHLDVVAIFDADRIAPRLNLPRGTEDDVVLAEIRRRAPSPHVHPFMLHDRLETVVDAAARCLDWDPPPPLPKDVMLRDRVLKRAAFSHARAPRDCVLNAVPSLAAVVDFLAHRLAASAPSTPGYQSSR